MTSKKFYPLFKYIGVKGWRFLWLMDSTPYGYDSFDESQAEIDEAYRWFPKKAAATFITLELTAEQAWKIMYQQKVKRPPL